MPEPGKCSKLSFRNFSNDTRAPFVRYADFEALIHLKDAGPTRGQKTYLYEQHRPCTVGYEIKSYFTDLDEAYRVIHGPDCVIKFIRRMNKLEKKVMDY